MKKVLFASTALVLTAGVASADIVVSGDANMGLKYDGSRTSVHNEVNFTFAGSGETEGGLSFGGSADIELSSDDNDFEDSEATDPEVFIAYNGLKLTVGNIGEATDSGLSDIGYDGIGIDDVAEKPDGANNGLGKHNVRVDYAFGDFSVAMSMDSSDGSDDWALALGGSFDAVSFNIGFGETGADDVVNVKVGYSAGAFGLDALYRESLGEESYGVRGSYTTGDVTVAAMYGENDEGDAWGIGVDYDLGGATLAGGIGEAGDETVADLGISFSF